MRAAYHHIEPLVSLAIESGVAGDFIELGVWRGDTFLALAAAAAQAHRHCHAVDSFQGCGDPGPRDNNQYPRGSLTVNGSSAFRKLVSPLGGAVVVHEGWVPEVLAEIDADRFAFAHIDLDHYAPTLDALRWIWPLMPPGGIVACHDYIPGRDILATGAISDWMKETGLTMTGWQKSLHAWFVKPETGAVT